MANTLHIKKDDVVVALSGSFKGKTGKVVKVSLKKGAVQVEGLGLTKRHTKPSQTSPKGGIVEKNRWLPASKFAKAKDSSSKKK